MVNVLRWGRSGPGCRAPSSWFMTEISSPLAPFRVLTVNPYCCDLVLMLKKAHSTTIIMFWASFLVVLVLSTGAVFLLFSVVFLFLIIRPFFGFLHHQRLTGVDYISSPVEVVDPNLWQQSREFLIWHVVWSEELNLQPASRAHLESSRLVKWTSSSWWIRKTNKTTDARL